MTPEMIEGKKYLGQHQDLFALGVMLFTLHTGHLPFQMADAKNYWYELIVKGNFEQFWLDHEEDKNG